MEVVATFRDILINNTYHEQDYHYNTISNGNLSVGDEQLLLESQFYHKLLADFWDNLYTHRQPSSVLLICLYVPVFLIALFGNLLVLLVVLLHKHMRNVTNGFIVNLAIADMLVTLICIPTAVGQAVYRIWVYGEFICKITGYMQGVSVASSVFTIMLLSIDRYLAIRHPMTFRTFSTVRHAAKLTITVWVLSLCIMVPLLLVRRVDVIELLPGQNLAFCSEAWSNNRQRQVYDIFLFTCVFVLPGCFVTLSYSRIGCRLWREDRHLHRGDSSVAKEAVERVMSGRRKVARMLVVLAILFASCWMPYHLLSVYLAFVSSSEHGTGKVGLVALPFTLWLGHANSALNPVLYCFLSCSFRRAACRMVRQKVCPSACWGNTVRKKRPTNQKQVDLMVEITPLNKSASFNRRPLVRVFTGSSGNESRGTTGTTGSTKFSTRSSFRSSCRSSRSSTQNSAGPAVTLKVRDIRKKSTKRLGSSMMSGGEQGCAKTDGGCGNELLSPSSVVAGMAAGGDVMMMVIPGEPYEKPLYELHLVGRYQAGSVGTSATIVSAGSAAGNSRGRHEIFDSSLNIPTTINEETSRGSLSPNNYASSHSLTQLEHRMMSMHSLTTHDGDSDAAGSGSSADDAANMDNHSAYKTTTF